MTIIIFDLDDTLYDQFIPFKKAFIKVVGKSTLLTIKTIYRRSRDISEDLFDRSEKELLPMKEMHIIRIQSACKESDILLTRQQSIYFQEVYRQEQQQIQLYPEMKELLNKLYKDDYTLALMTNGPVIHQKQKIKNLGLKKWFTDSNIFISSEIGYSKPDKLAFEHLEQQLNIGIKKPIFIGDSYKNDVIGGKKSGWKVIWLNKQPDNCTQHKIKPDKMVRSPREILALFNKN